MEGKRHDKSFMASKLFKFRKDSIGRDIEIAYIYICRKTVKCWAGSVACRGKASSVLISSGGWQEALRLRVGIRSI